MNTGKYIIIAFGILIAIGLYNAFTTPDTSKASYIENNEHYFSAMSGYNPELADAVKKGMYSPSSFDHVDTRILSDNGGMLRLEMEYKEKTSTGALVNNKVVADFDKATRKISGLRTL